MEVSFKGDDDVKEAQLPAPDDLDEYEKYCFDHFTMAFKGGVRLKVNYQSFDIQRGSTGFNGEEDEDLVKLQQWYRKQLAVALSRLAVQTYQHFAPPLEPITASIFEVPSGALAGVDPSPGRILEYLPPEIDRLAEYIQTNFRVREGGAVDNAIEIMKDQKIIIETLEQEVADLLNGESM